VFSYYPVHIHRIRCKKKPFYNFTCSTEVNTKNGCTKKVKIQRKMVSRKG
jgi:hypothetical protein